MGNARGSKVGKAKARRPWYLSLPSSQFRRDPWFYLKYDLTWMALLLGLVALMRAVGWTGVDLSVSWWLLPLLIGACYVQVMAGVCIHNASHENFPRPINRICGELLGTVVATRFASWEILHRRHHMYSDDVEKDPHPATPTFVGFLVGQMLLNLERNLHQQYYELWGDTPAVRRRDNVRSVVSFLTAVALLYFWYALLGSVAYFYVFVPALVIGVVQVAHFNWVTHNARVGTGDYHPINVDSGPYWVANRLLFGLYMHANHHAFARLFNPMNLGAKQQQRVEVALRTRSAVPAMGTTMAAPAQALSVSD